MKSKKKQRILALILSMVLMLSASISALAEGDVQTEASGTETTENQAAAQSLEQETVPETEVTTEEGEIDTQSAETSTEPVQENTEQEVTETPAQTEQGVTEETTETTDTTQSQAQSTEVQEESDAAEEIPVEEQPGETTEETVTEETVVSEAAELKQEFTDENGNVTQTVTAYVPEGAFQATADQISMEVSLLNTDDTNYIKGMMEELLPENHYLGGYVLYQIDFKVNGEITQPAKAVTITMNGNDLAVEDTQKAHVFYYDSEDPEVEGDKDQLIEVTQKDQLLKSLEEAGQSAENIEDYDYSEIAINEGNADSITVKGWHSTIYGCYVEKEAVTELTYEDDSVTVTVSADEAGIIPEGAELSVTPITKTEITNDMSEEEKAQAEEINAQYDLTEKKLTEDSEKNEETMEGFLAYDICFLVDGEEVEPSGDVKVVMDFKEAAVPEGVSEEAEVTVKHLKEDESAEDGVVVEDMASQSTVQTTENAVQKIELTSNSFSIYAVSWSAAVNEADAPMVLADTTVDASVTVGDSVTLYGYGSSAWYHEWTSSNSNILRVTDSSNQNVTIRGLSTGTVTLTHRYRNSNNSQYRTETFTVEVIDYIKVYVYVAGSGISNECLELLGIDINTLDGNGYFPAGEIHLDPDFLEGKRGADTPGEALITRERDWTELLAALSDMNTSTLFDQSDFDFSGLKESSKLDYSQNAGNSLPEYYDQAETDINYTWGSKMTALFRWHDDPSYANDRTNDYRGHYGFADQSVKYHLDLRFKTNTITFILGENGIDSGEARDGKEVDSRTYITGSEIQDPRNLNIPDGYYFDGFYKDRNFKTPWDGIGTPLNEDEIVYIKLSRYPVLTMTKIFDGLSDAEVNYLIFGMTDGFGWDINYCNEDTHQSNTGSNHGQTFMEEDIPDNFELPDGTNVTGGGDFRITAAQFLETGENAINDISDVSGTYENEETGATLYKNSDGNWVYSISLPVPPTDDNQFYTVFEQHQEVPGYAKINDSSAEWQIRQDGSIVDSGTGKFIDNDSNNIYESMSEINENSTEYNGTDYNEMEDVCIETGAFKRITITDSMTITFTNHYEGDLKVTKNIGSSNQYEGADTKEYRITVQPADINKLALNSVTHGLAGKSFTYEIINTDGSTDTQGTISLNEQGAFEIVLSPGQVAHFIDMPAIQWKTTENRETNAVEGYSLNITYADANNGVVNEQTHWNKYGNGDTIGGTFEEDGIASVDNAVRDNNRPQVDADAVAQITVTNEYTPVTGNLTITKEVVGAEVEEKSYSFTISTTNALVAGQSYGIGDSEAITFSSDTDLNGQYTATVTVLTTTADNGVDGSIKINGLPAGTYMVTEDTETAAVDGYQLVSIVYRVDQKEISTLEISGGTDSQMDVTNIYSKEWQMVKISSSTSDNGQKLYLGGAEFTAIEQKTNKEYTGSSAEKTGLITWNDGQQDIGTMLPDGIYTIKETKAPDAYTLEGDNWTLTVEDGVPIIKINGNDVESDKTGAVDIFYLENDALYDLPSAGGPGIFLYMIGGTLLLMAGSLMIYINRRKGVLRK